MEIIHRILLLVACTFCHFEEGDPSDSEQAKQISTRSSTKIGLSLRSYLLGFLLRRNDKNERESFFYGKKNFASLRLCEINSKTIRGYTKNSLQFSTEIHIIKRELLNTLANYNSTK